jgi:hypothetical protein
MALDYAQRAQGVRTALSLIGRSRGQISDAELYDRIRDRLDLPAVVSLSDNMSIQGVIRSARSMASYAGSIQGGRAAPTRQPPPDPTLYGSEYRYRYRVLIEWQDPTTGDRYSTVLNIDSDVELSREVILSEAQDIAANTSFDPDYKHGITSITMTGITRVVITSAGRRP